jgi:putative ABC transport system permease protein
MALLFRLRAFTRPLLRRRLRTVLMITGVVVATASLTTLQSVGEAARRETMQRFRNMLGTFDTILIRPGAARTRGMVSLTNVPPTLTFDDAAAIAAGVPGVAQVAEVQNAFDIDVKYRDRADSPAVFGVSANWSLLRGDAVQDGAFISDDDVRGLARVAVLGADVVPVLFPGESPIGKTLRIGNVPFEVTGILASRGAGPGGASLDHIILIPVTTASQRLFNRTFLTMLIAQVRDPERSASAAAGIAALLRDRHHIAADAQDDFSLNSPEAVMSQVTELGSTLGAILKGLAVAATIMAAALITALMLTSVTERRVEIGVRRTVGAARGQVLRQFVGETVVVTTAGGLIGVGAAVAGAAAAGWWQHLPMAIDWRLVAANLGLSIGFGVVVGLYPAWSAARVDPIRAVRS